MNELAESFNDAVDAAEESTGERPFIIFRGRKLDALISDLGADIVPGFGGVTDAGTVTVAIRDSDIPDDPPGDNESITVRGKELSVLSALGNGVTWVITAGDATNG